MRRMGHLRKHSAFVRICITNFDRFGGSFGGDMKEIELDSCPWEQPLQNFPTDSQPMRSLEMPRLRLNKQYDKSVNFD